MIKYYVHFREKINADRVIVHLENKINADRSDQISRTIDNSL